jgi:CHAD domain-containing protein
MAKPTPLPALHPSDRVRDIASAVLAVRIGDVRRFEESVEGNLDSEAIHDMRVASRRLRATVRFLGLPRRCSDDVKQLQDALGGVRDIQVQTDALTRVARRTPTGVKSALQHVIRAIGADLDDRERALRKALRRWRAKAAPGLEEAAGHLETERTLGGGHYRKELPRRLHQLKKRIDAFRRDTGPEVAHRLRIEAKKLRYEAELLAEVRPEARWLLAELVPVQESLGDLHDLDVRLALVRVHLKGRQAKGLAATAAVARFVRARPALVREALRSSTAVRHAARTLRWNAEDSRTGNAVVSSPA